MGKFHVISHLQKYNKGPIIESILRAFYMVHLALSLTLNYYYWAQVYPLNLGEHNHIPLAQISGILHPHPVLQVGEGLYTQASRQTANLETSLPLSCMWKHSLPTDRAPGSCGLRAVVWGCWWQSPQTGTALARRCGCLPLGWSPVPASG